MTGISHHIPDPMIAAYATGSMPPTFSLVVATHVSLCDECRTRLGAHQAAGGAVLESTDSHEVSDDLRDRVFAALDKAPIPAPVFKRSGVFPAPVMEALGGEPPKWRSVGLGVRQSIISSGRDGSVRLLYIPPGREMPDHGHHGLEMTMVLQGAFRDHIGRFGVGDVEIGDDDLEHTPVAEDGAPCICLAATDANLRFTSFLPRILQPIFKI